MKLEINGNIEEIQYSTIDEVLDELNIQKQGIAVAVNEAVVPKSMWGTFQISEKDKIMIITATAGG